MSGLIFRQLQRTAGCRRALVARAFAQSAVARADPYVLPGTPEHIRASAHAPEEPYQKQPGEEEVQLDLERADLPFPTRIERPGESHETMRARLVYQARKRGTRETELLLSTFAKERMDELEGRGLWREFDELMDEPDWEIYYWATERKTPPARWEGSVVLEMLKKHAKNEGREVRRMPDL